MNETWAGNAALSVLSEWETVVAGDGHMAIAERAPRTDRQIADELLAALSPIIAAGALRDAAAELDECGHRHAGQVLRRLADEREATK